MMASMSNKSVESTESKVSERECNVITADLPGKAQECLIEKALCTLTSMGQKNRPKLRSALQNSLAPCTVVAPYISPLDALAAANEASTQPNLSVNVSHAKRRVYTMLETVRKAKKERLTQKTREGRKYELAPRESDIEKGIVGDVITWLKSDPEGTEESLVNQLVQRCEKKVDCSSLVFKKLQDSGIVKLDESERVIYLLPPAAANPRHGRANRNARARVMRLLQDCPPLSRPSTVPEFLEFIRPPCIVWFTVAPARLLGMNMRRIKHRPVKDKSDGDAPGQTKMVQTQKSNKRDSISKSESEWKTKVEFAIGVQPGENDAREQISLTPRGMTGTEVSISDQPPPPKRSKTIFAPKPDGNERLRAVGQCKGLSGFFTNRLTVAVRGNNAVLVPANEKEKENIISRVAEWVDSVRQCTTTAQPGPSSATVSANPPKKTVAKLQEELANMCVGKMRRLAPSAINDLLLKSGYITIDDKHRVTYQLPTDRGNQKLSWQQQTIETAAKSCVCTRLLKEAFPSRSKGKGGNKRKTPRMENKTRRNTAPALPLVDYDDYSDDYSDNDYHDNEDEQDEDDDVIDAHVFDDGLLEDYDPNPYDNYDYFDDDDSGDSTSSE